MASIALESPTGSDPEELYAALTTLMPLVTDVVTAAEGTLIRHPSALIVVFGAPVAHEDDCLRAIETAIHLLDILQQPSEYDDLVFTPRAGLSYGLAVAGHVGNQIHSEFIVKGKPMEEAYDLARSAPPGALWVSQSVRNATELSFNFQTVSPTNSAVAPLELVGPAFHSALDEVMASKPTPFVGREQELASLSSFAERLKQGVGGLVWVVGEAGIGKSRLTNEFATRLTPSGVRVATGKCLARRTNQAFSLFSDLLASIFELPGDSEAAEVRSRIDTVCERFLVDNRIARPILEVLVGVKPEESDERLLGELETEQLQQQMFVTVRNLLVDLTVDKPLLIVLDDVHWIDSWSAKLLRYLSSVVQSSPILFLCTSRVEEAERVARQLGDTLSSQDAHTLHLRIESLPSAERDELLNALADGQLPVSVSTHIADLSQGNPFFLEELFQALAVQFPVDSPHGLGLEVSAFDRSELHLPDTLEALIHAADRPASCVFKAITPVQRCHRSTIQCQAPRDSKRDA